MHISRWSEATFDEMTVHFTDLAPWVNISGFKRGKQKNWTIEHERPEEIEFPSGQGFRLVFAASVNHQHASDRQSIEEGWLLRLEYKHATPFRTIRAHLLELRRFLMLATQRAVFQTSFVGRRKVDREMLGRVWLGREITCFTPGMEHEFGKLKRKRSWEMLFTFADVRSAFRRMLPTWLRYGSTFSDALSLYFSCLENKHLYGNHQILFLAQALEVYHRTHVERYKQAVETKAEFRARRKRLTANLDPDDAQWLTDKLQWVNQPTLNERLLDIFESKRSLLGTFLGDEAAFARRIKDLRNHYTHYAAKKKNPDDDHPSDSFELCYKMRIVLQVCFLSDIGVPEPIIKKLLRKFDWTVVNFTEVDEDEPPIQPPVGTLALKAPAKKAKMPRGKPSKN